MNILAEQINHVYNWPEAFMYVGIAFAVAIIFWALFR